LGRRCWRQRGNNSGAAAKGIDCRNSRRFMMHPDKLDHSRNGRQYLMEHGAALLNQLLEHSGSQSARHPGFLFDNKGPRMLPRPFAPSPGVPLPIPHRQICRLNNEFFHISMLLLYPRHGLFLSTFANDCSAILTSSTI
jgi:hypothetical protein